MRNYILLFCVLAPGLYAVDITGTLEATLEAEVNRTFYFAGDGAIAGSLTVNHTFTVSAGGSMGILGNVFSPKAFARLEYALPLKVPLAISCRYIYNGLPEYKTHIHTVLPMVTLGYRYAGISVGPAWHFTRFGETALITEPVLAFTGYVNFYNAEKGRIGVEWSNVRDFSSGNMGAYFLRVYSLIHLTPHLGLINDLTLYQTGSVGLAANFSGAAYRGGVSFLF